MQGMRDCRQDGAMVVLEIHVALAEGAMLAQVREYPDQAYAAFFGQRLMVAGQGLPHRSLVQAHVEADDEDNGPDAGVAGQGMEGIDSAAEEQRESAVLDR